jgi:hypothetical protein
MISTRLPRWFGLGLIGLLILAVLATIPSPPAQARSDTPIMALYYSNYNIGNWTYDAMSDIAAPKYSSGSHEAMDRHIEQAYTAGIDAFICNWRGPDDQSDGRCRGLQKRIEASEYDSMRIVFQIELSADSDEDLLDPDGLAKALRKLEEVTQRSSYMRFQGKPLFIFINPVYFGNAEDWRRFRNQVDLYRTQFWLTATTIQALQDDVFSYLDVFDGTYSYELNPSPHNAMATYAYRLNQYNNAHQEHKPFIAMVMPGYDDRRINPQGMVIERNNGLYYQTSWQAVKQRSPAAIILNSFNDFYQGTHIEPSEVYATGYLGLTQDLIDDFFSTRPTQTRDVSYMPETGHYLGGAFRTYWQNNNGLQRFGYPITEEYIRESDGKIVQYFERARFELLVSNGQPVVELGLLGKEYVALYDRDFPKPAPFMSTSTARYFPETGYSIQGHFKTYWETHGGISIFGFPISEQITVRLSDGQDHRVQYFERVRMEQHGNTILLGRLGIDLAPCDMLNSLPPNAPPNGPLQEKSSDPCAEYFYDKPTEARDEDELVELPVTSPASNDPTTANLGEGLNPMAHGRVYPQVVQPNTIQGFEAWDYLPNEEVSLWYNLPDGSTRGLPYTAMANNNGYVLIGIQTERTDPIGNWSLVGKGITSGRVVVAPFQLQWD